MVAIRQKRSRPMFALGVIAAAALGLASPGSAQMRSVDPDTAIDGDLAGPAPTSPAASPSDREIAPAPTSETQGEPAVAPYPTEPTVAPGPTETAASSAAAGQGGETYRKDDLIGAAEGVFGKGAKGIADVIEDILQKQGEPNAYIVGREGGGAVVVGLRYGSGTLYHKVEGQRPVYWTGPSIGFDAGANAGSAFVLVYNLHDSGDLYQRFPAGEGQAYLVGGFNVSYLRSGDMVLIPVRLGVGLRLGANVGYMKFSQRQNWLPF
jgi:hypothetical protein